MTTEIEDVIYKIVTSDQWVDAEEKGVFKGAPVDLADGYIHLSTAKQVRETAARHFAGQHDLLLISVSSSLIGEELVYETSRSGALFPHLYGDLPLSAVIDKVDLPLGIDGRHQFPEALA